MKKTSILSLIFAVSAGMFAQNEPKEIHSVEELKAISANEQSMEGSYILMNDLMVENWTPIGGLDGDENKGFEGILDGNGHTITIQSFDMQLDNSRVGLFGFIAEKGVVKNLRIAGKVSYTGGQKILYIGGIAGFNKGLITCCVSSIDLTGDFAKTEHKKKVKTQFGYETGQYGGGIAGINLGTIKHCYSDGSVHIPPGFAGGIAAVNGKPIAGSFGISVGSGGVGVAMAPGLAEKITGGIAFCYSTATVSGTMACGVVAIYQPTTFMSNVVALNPLLEAKGIVPKATPLPGIGALGISHPNFQFHYRDDMVTRRYNEKNKEKSSKISPKRAVAFSTTQQESWWQLPDGLDPKEKQKVLGFPFGDEEETPWKWSGNLKRPVLYWEADMPEKR